MKTKAERRWAREAKEARDKLYKAITRLSMAKRPDGVRCVEWQSEYFCSGRMKVNKHGARCAIHKGGECDCSIQSRTSVWAHCLPVFCQCSGCGFAPGLTEQAVLLGYLISLKRQVGTLGGKVAAK